VVRSTSLSGLLIYIIEELNMKKVTCSQMRTVSDADLKHIYGGGAAAGGQADKVKNVPQTRPSGKGGCVAGARQTQNAPT